LITMTTNFYDFELVNFYRKSCGKICKVTKFNHMDATTGFNSQAQNPGKHWY